MRAPTVFRSHLAPATLRFAIAALISVLALCTLSWLGAAPARADVQDFSYDRWHVNYEIGVGPDGRSHARVTETITAVFPQHDQNRGIVRGIPDRYEGAGIEPRDFTVTDDEGTPVPFEIETDEGFTAVLTGDSSFVHGATTYEISYTLSDVVLARDDGTADEFYWDIMDFEHEQSVDAFSATVRFTGKLGSDLNGQASCYVGTASSVNACSIEQDDAATPSWHTRSVPLAPREGVTVAIGLTPGSVVQPATRLPSVTFDVLPLIASGLALLIGVASFAAAVRFRRRRRVARGTTIAQYDVPASLPPLLAASIAGTSPHPVPAELVHLAVGGAIRIEASKPRPTLHLDTPERAVDQLDQCTLRSVFGEPVPGASFSLPKSSETFARHMTKLRERGDAEAIARGYIERAHSRVGRAIGYVGVVLAVAAMVFGVTALVVRESPLGLIAVFAGGAALTLSLLGILPKRVHTSQGAEAYEYLMGVREFIRVAEADRLAVLQSYSGAQRRQQGDIEIVQIYERLLPYAMIFGLQKQWTKALEVRYEQSVDYAPAWLVGAGLGAVHVSDLSSSISQFTSSASSSVSYTSSSAGGSGGGGYAGGGGGGGFSGGR